ncbi:LarC family nickel insertion protein [Lichenicola sp.]|uniref:LarC family nickel insertion protein n=1 Tax=Lichenicola sp. TaxID=2804529 RepID=UPI003B004D08
MIHVHLDPLGGVAGDMFAAALLAAYPGHAASVDEAVRRAAPVQCRLRPFDDGVLTGMQFNVETPGGEPADHAGHDHGHEHHHDHDHHDDQAHGHDRGDAHDHDHDHDHHRHRAHGHRAWSDIRAHLQACGLADAVRDHALGIFAVLAEAEGRVHGKPADAVTFHEVGAADSIADIVAAAVLIDRIGAASWSISALPIGGGRIRTAHGIMPVPAPATVLLLDGFELLDDGIAGERVTPTGAAILRYLRASGLLQARPAGRLSGTGIGFGTRRLPGTSNCLRVLLLDVGGEATVASAQRSLVVIAFEVDDQSGEDLAAGLDRVRAVAGVHDVVQMMAIGKKGRLTIHVQVLAAPDALAEATEACFRETTTIGLRTHLVEGQALPRRMAQTMIDGVPVAVKLVQRPDGQTGKAEADHLLGLPGHATRTRLRRQAEATAAEQEPAS